MTSIVMNSFAEGSKTITGKLKTKLFSIRESKTVMKMMNGKETKTNATYSRRNRREGKGKGAG